MIMMFSTSNPSAALVTIFYILLVSLTLVRNASAATSDDWRGRSIYQLVTDRFALSDGSTAQPCNTTAQLYCGGTFQGVINKLDYIQGMGFTAIWISPVVKNINDTGSFGQAYHGFWSQDITQINDHFGTADDLKALSKALHDRDMYLMLDVVANNYAYAGPHENVVYSNFVPFNNKEYFHNYCPVTNYSDPTNAQQCWLGNDLLSLPDMNTENAFVQSTWNQWGKDMVSNYSIDGMRIDAAKHIAKPFWNSFQSAVNVYTIGEFFSNVTEDVCDYMSGALSAVLDYPMSYAIVGVFTNTSQSMTGLEDNSIMVSSDCQDSTLVGTFSENQDIARFASYTSDLAILKNVLAFTIMSDGVPIVYYGAEQGFSGPGDPWNREPLWSSNYSTSSPLYTHIASLNAARNVIGQLADYTYWSSYWTYKTKMVLVKDEMMAIRKGYDRSIVTILTNRGSAAPEMGPYEISDTNFDEGDTIVEVLGCTSMVVGQYGVFSITIPAGGDPMVWIPAKWITNTTLCPSVVSQYKSSPQSSSFAARTAGPMFLSNPLYALSMLALAALALS